MSKQIKNNQLYLGGVSALCLAKEYGTPLYVMDEEVITDAMHLYTDTLKQGYGGHGLVCYASKAFACKEIFRLAKTHGLGIDVVSGGELHTALAAGFDMSKVCFHGSNKSTEELKLAVKNKVGRIIVDNLDELENIKSIINCNKSTYAETSGIGIMLRIKPGVTGDTHSHIKTGQVDSKFGFCADDAAATVKAALGITGINILGLHCHIGSQIFESKPFISAAQIMIELLCKINKETGAELSELNLGGGFGVSYTSDTAPMDFKACLYNIFDAVKTTCTKNGVTPPFLILEPGRSVVAAAGTTLYSVGNIKEIPSVRTYLSIDGGMCDNPRYILYEAKYEMALANKISQPKNKVYTIAGKCCESGDLIGENIPLQEAKKNDILAVFNTGAYNFSMFSNYNRTLRPAVIMVKGGKSRIIVKRETYARLIEDDI